MKMHFSDVEGRALHGLLEDASDDVVVRLDNAGFIIHASANAAELGIDLASLLLMPHISDFAENEHAAEVGRYVTKIFSGEEKPRWIEFPVVVCRGQSKEDCECGTDKCRRWYGFSLKLIDDDDGAAQGALGLLRSVHHKRSLEHDIDARAHTDPLTGLANRHAFCAILHRTIAAKHSQSVAVLAVDRMRAMFMQYGQRTSDEILWGFGQFLETMTRPGQEVALLDGERFGVILPGQSMKQARLWADDVLKTFAGLAVSSSTRTPELTASAGIAQVEMTVDWTLRQAELGLVMARAGGGMQVGVCGQRACAVGNGANVERAMEAAKQRAVHRND